MPYAVYTPAFDDFALTDRSAREIVWTGLEGVGARGLLLTD